MCLVRLVSSLLLVASGCQLETDAIPLGVASAMDGSRDSASGDGGEPRDGSPPDSDVGRVDAATPDARVDTGPVEPSTPFCDPTDASLVLCVLFEDVFADESTASHMLRETGLAYDTGRVGRAGVFGPSAAAWVEQGGDLTGEPLTIELFLMPRTLPASGRMGVWDIGGQHSAWVHAGAAFSCRSVTAAAVLTAGTWTHIACVLNGDESQVWIDGTLAATGVSAPGTPGAGDIRVGANEPDGDHFDGRLDEMRIFRRVRSAGEIAAAASR